MSRNSDDTFLLHHDPGSLILKYLEVISIIIQKRLINTGYFLPEEKDDLVQTVCKQLIEKAPSIKKNYNGSSMLITYCSSVINNLCNGMIRELKKQPVTIHQLPDYVEYDGYILERLLVNETIDKFGKIMRLYHNKRFKLEFCLKSYFRVRLSSADYEYLAPKMQMDPARFFEIFNDLSENQMLTKNEIYNYLTIIMNELEHVDNGNDAIRKWLNVRIAEILVLLNGNPKSSCFDEETLQILLEKYFSKDSILITP